VETFKKLVIENPDDVNFVTPEEGRSLLHFAASIGNVECMKILILQVIIRYNIHVFVVYLYI